MNRTRGGFFSFQRGEIVGTALRRRRARRAPLQTVLERTEVKTLSGANLKALLCVALCPGLSTLRIAHRSGLHVVTTRRAVRELCARGLVVSDVEGKWKCTP